MIPYGKQSISEDDIQAVVEVLRSDFLTQGPLVPKFEEAICRYVGSEYAVAVNSGTSALHLACRALGLGPGDILWTTPISFVASANCGLYCGAKVDFVDIDPRTFNMSVAALEEKLKVAERDNQLPRIVVPVHLCGLPCEMEEISRLAKQYGFKTIEDASHAIGAKIKNEPVGNCQYSDITVFSFHPVKTITTGEGGMAVTNQKILADKMELLRSHGITRDETLFTNESEGSWYYEQIDLGYNYRMTDLQAALGISQLQRVEEFVSRRHSIADKYNNYLKGLPVVSQLQPEDRYSGRHLYVIRLQTNLLKKSHRVIFEELRENGIGVNVHYIPIHYQPVYKEIGFNQGDFPEAEKYYHEAISLPIYPDLKNDELLIVVNTLEKVLN